MALELLVNNQFTLLEATWPILAMQMVGATQLSLAVPSKRLGLLAILEEWAEVATPRNQELNLTLFNKNQQKLLQKEIFSSLLAGGARRRTTAKAADRRLIIQKS